MSDASLEPLSSGLSFFSVGRVAENKNLSEDVIHAVPIEHIPTLSGEFQKHTEKLELEGLDKDDNAYQMSLDMELTIPAKWFPLTSNRQTPPDVRRGVRVLLWRYKETDQFYWTDMGLDQNLFKRETVRYVFSANDDESDTEVTPDNHYWFEICTHTKKITLHTTTALGEPFSYDIQLNTGEGSFTITDNDGNYGLLDSTNQLWHFKNKDGTELKLDKKEIYAFAKGLIKIRSDKKIHATAPLIDLGEESALEPSVLGDKLAAYMTKLELWLNNHTHIGNLGIPTSVPIVPHDATEAKPKGIVYSVKNRNQ